MGQAALAVVQSQDIDIFDEKRLQMVRDKFANGAPQDEFDLFIEVCRSRNLDPLTRQVYLIPRYDSREGKKVWSIQTSIDGYRSIADRTGAYAGSDEATFVETGKKIGEPAKVRPDTATVTVWKMVQGVRCPFTATARWDEYFQEKSPLWGRMPHTMLAKCAESLALRKAFPVQLGGMYTTEEMMQAGTTAEVETVTARPSTRGTSPRVTEVTTEHVDRETGEIIDVTPTPIQSQERKSGYAPRSKTGKPLTEKQFGKILAECSERGIDDNARHALLIAQFAKESLNDLLLIEASAFIDWLLNQSPEQIAAAVGEATRAQAKARGQTEMPMPEEAPATFRRVPRDQLTEEPVEQGVTETGEVVSWTVAWKRLRELGCESQMHWIELTEKTFPKDDPQAAITLYQQAKEGRDQAIDGTAGNDRYSR